ncbi:MAG: phosphoribosylaminoimidazolesuccinocarboxamide synthase [Nitrospirota bacterium]
MGMVLKTEIPALGEPRRGKVRDIYDLGEHLLLVVTDRISAFDVVLPGGIPGKGKVLTEISLFWFRRMKDLMENHVVSASVADFPPELHAYRQVLEGRSLLVRKAEVIPVECIVRGYLSGSGWKSYQKDGTVCGIALPGGLRESSRLPEPLFTPSTKAAAGHDINISFREMQNTVGTETARLLRERSLSIYARASELAEKKGIIIADTKMEFGLREGRVILIDELLTPDSSRFWSRRQYEEGKSQDSYDKQIVRDYLLTLDWDQSPPGPELPPHIVQKTAERYREILEILTH